jgi:hypothetical protein
MQPNVQQDVKDVQTVVNNAQQEVTALKSGYKTTEFWLHLAAQVVAILVIVLPNSSAIKAIAALSSAGSASIYSMGRVMLKRN